MLVTSTINTITPLKLPLFSDACFASALMQDTRALHCLLSRVHKGFGVQCYRQDIAA